MLATTLPARGMFDHHPFGLGISGGYARAAGKRLLQEADLIIAIGASLSNFTADAGKLFRNAKVIQIDTAPLGLKHGRKAADIYLCADAKEALSAIIARLPSDRPDPGWRQRCGGAGRSPTTRRTARTSRLEPDLIDPRDAVLAIDSVIPKDWEVVNSSGHCAFFTAQLRGRRPENFNVIREFGAIGNRPLLRDRSCGGKNPTRRSC